MDCEECKHYLGTVAFSKDSRVTHHKMCGYYGYPYFCERFVQGSSKCDWFESTKPPTVSWEEARAAMREGKVAYREDLGEGARVNLGGCIYYNKSGNDYVLIETDFTGRWIIVE